MSQIVLHKIPPLHYELSEKANEMDPFSQHFDSRYIRENVALHQLLKEYPDVMKYIIVPGFPEDDPVLITYDALKLQFLKTKEKICIFHEKLKNQHEFENNRLDQLQVNLASYHDDPLILPFSLPEFLKMYYRHLYVINIEYVTHDLKLQNEKLSISNELLKLTSRLFIVCDSLCKIPANCRIFIPPLKTIPSPRLVEKVYTLRRKIKFLKSVINMARGIPVNNQPSLFDIDYLNRYIDSHSYYIPPDNLITQQLEDVFYSWLPSDYHFMTSHETIGINMEYIAQEAHTMLTKAKIKKDMYSYLFPSCFRFFHGLKPPPKIEEMGHIQCISSFRRWIMNDEKTQAFLEANKAAVESSIRWINELLFVTCPLDVAFFFKEALNCLTQPLGVLLPKSEESQVRNSYVVQIMSIMLALSDVPDPLLLSRPLIEINELSWFPSEFQNASVIYIQCAYALGQRWWERKK